MLGAIVGDIVGSVYEWKNHRSKSFQLFDPRAFFTDDSVLTVATAEAILTDGDFESAYRRYFERYPNAGFGGRFRQWGMDRSMGPYNSFGNGSAMRIAPVGWARSTLDETLDLAAESARVTHNHPEGLRGALTVAGAIFLARTGEPKEAIREAAKVMGYDLSFTIDEIRPTYKFNESCQETVPQAIVAFLESTSFEDAIRTAVSVGGDTDTLTCITGGIAEAFYGGVPPEIAKEAMARLDDNLRSVTSRFRSRLSEGPSSPS